MAKNLDQAPQAPEGINPKAWAISSAAPRLRPDQARRITAVITRHRASQSNSEAS